MDDGFTHRAASAAAEILTTELSQQVKPARHLKKTIKKNNNIMNEQFVTKKTADLAKQAGFDWGVQNFYKKGDDTLYTPAIIAMADYNWNRLDNIYSAPTQAVLQRWLREVKNIQIWSEYHILITGGVWLVYYGEYSCKTVDLDYLNGFSTYEEAIEAGLQKCLIKIIENR